MKFESLYHVYNALKYNNPQKRAFILSLKYLSVEQAEKILRTPYYHPGYIDPHFIKARELGISDSLVRQAARWALGEQYWKNFDFNRLEI